MSLYTPGDGMHIHLGVLASVCVSCVLVAHGSQRRTAASLGLGLQVLVTLWVPGIEL